MPMYEAALSSAIQIHQAGRLDEAERAYRQIIAAEPANVAAWYLLGTVAFQRGEHELAEQSFRRTISLSPGIADAHNNLGLTLAIKGISGEARACFGEALRLNPDLAEAHYNIANVLARDGKSDDAVLSYRRAIELRPNYPQAHCNLGTALQFLGMLGEAAACYRHAFELVPNYAEAINNLGSVLQSEGRFEDAQICHRRALEINPQYTLAAYNLGTALMEKGCLDEAADCFQRVTTLDPQHADAHGNLGLVLQEQFKVEEAIASHQRALVLRPNHADTLLNLGTALKAQGLFDEAETSYRRVLQVIPEHPGARWNIGTLMLLRGDFERGWQEYEWRWKTGEIPVREFGRPRWSWEAVEGKTVLLWAEQGLGDTIQFVRYAAMVKRLGARVVVECQRPLLKLLGGCVGIDQLIAGGDELPAFDAQAPLLSLPGIFRTRLETIPAEVPYLAADAALVAEWRERLGQIGGFRIGINWRGRIGKRESQQRDVPLELFASLSRVPGVRLVSLQKVEGGPSGAGSRQPDPSLALRACVLGEAHPTVVDVGEFDAAHGAFMDTAAIMMNLDLVITSDTSVAHVAGALGVPVWVALPFVPDWRWLLDRFDSPWYPTMRLFRQRAPGDWPGVIDQIRGALRQVTIGCRPHRPQS